MLQEVLARVEQTEAHATFGAHVREGLKRTPKALPSKYLYDTVGSRLFEQITREPEYYIPKAETEILTKHAEDIRACIGEGPIDIVELGCGCHEKTFRLLGAFADVVGTTYMPVDISDVALQKMRAELRRRLPFMPLHRMVADYTQALLWLQEHGGSKKRLFLFLGSSLGNMTDPEAAAFLLSVRGSMRPSDRFVVGFDLMKDIRTLTAAYNDAARTTAAFNLNLLQRINRELGGTFDVADFEHHPFYDPAQHSMVSWLVAKRDHHVTIGNDFETTFREGEGIFMERSRKWSRSEVCELSAGARLEVEEEFFDSRGFFLNAVLSPAH